MSFIEQALRRVQDPTMRKLEGAQPKTAEPATTAQPSGVHPWPTGSAGTAPGAQASRPMTPAMLTVVATVLGLTAALILGGAFWMGRTLGGRSIAAGRLGPEGPGTPATGGGSPIARATRVAASQPRFVLHGLVEGAGAPYAVINGEVLSVGDRVGDAVLVEISNGTATLRDASGTDTVLRVPR